MTELQRLFLAYDQHPPPAGPAPWPRWSRCWARPTGGRARGCS
ncbi:MAG: hypothetical protein WKG07_32280 [Hymenobacter sp.]